jgi:hypothetical protein
VFLRAHRLVEDGRLITERLGRTIIHAVPRLSTGGSVSRFQVAPGGFRRLSSHLDRRAVPGTRDDVDVGAGMRLAGGAAALLRLDVAGVWRDGRMRVSAGFQPVNVRPPQIGTTGAVATACVWFFGLLCLLCVTACDSPTGPSVNVDEWFTLSVG